MSSIAKERKQVMQGGPSASLFSSKASSSFCSLDVKIWEELHLQSLNSASSSITEDDSEKGHLWKAEKSREPKSSSQGFSFFSSTSARASFSGLSSPHRLSNASSTSGYSLMLNSRRDGALLSPFINSPLHYKAEQPPVVKVIQTGSMSFTGDELILQQASINTEEPFFIENPHLVESTTPPLEEEIPSMDRHPTISDDSPKCNEKSIVLGSFPHVKHMQISAPDIYSTPISPLKSKGSIPFKWEEMPGKPKLHADSAQAKPNIPTLQLPPKLLQSSFSLSNCNSPYSRSHSKHAASPTTSSVESFTSKPTSVKSLWHSFVQGGRRSYREGGGGRSRLNMLVSDEDPWSPTSTLIGPDASLSSTSSTSSSALDALCASPGRNAEAHSAASRGSGTFNVDEKSLCPQSSTLVPCSSSSSLSLWDVPSHLCNDLPNFAPSMERREEIPLSQKATSRLRGFLKSCQRWRSSRSHRKRNHEEAEMWEPTLATYFHSMELERSSSTSGQSLLSHQRSLEKHKHECNVVSPMQISSSAAASMDSYIGSMNGPKSLLPPSLMKEDIMIFSANSMNATEKPTLGLRGKSANAKKRRKGGGWVLRKLKKSSRVLAAMLRAMAKGNSNTGSTKKCKRRRLPYQHINA